ncbi:hypothetical protein [Rhodopseudomonas pseudopalustris]|uniref:LTXXQ motif family protein n=1 Tax=Rhodopseudomonas pseudopalustris TaxID=1513892 RepID=A0A1H8TNG1_9BRAD|nr:hypothetical protein [Rhodopseudomonas pseudopalustris]SEO92401.1 hypothetical protein SAMN05444123_10632 [Rhodopseudomonas pseudopalustris]
MTKAATLLALVCVLIAGASAATILARESVPAAGPAFAMAAVEGPVANRESKADRLARTSAATASTDAQSATEDAAPAQDDGQQLAAEEPAASQQPVQLAYATDDVGGLAVGAMPDQADRAVNSAPVTKLPPVIATAPAQKPKPAAKPKPPALLSDVQITQIKGRLNLSSSQEYFWPSVEQALRAIGRKLHATRVADSGPPPIDPDSAEVQQLKYAAMPLLFQLREDQKQEVRKLARAMGLEQVAQQI